MTMVNDMRFVRIEKITLNVGAGKEQQEVEKGFELLKYLTGATPIKTVTNKRIQEWGLRPGLPIGCKITLRKNKARELLKRLLEAKDNTLLQTQFDEQGNVAFGIHEYIDVPGVKYDPKLGIRGFEVCVTLARAGYRIKRRRHIRRKIPARHIVTKSDAIEFMKKNFSVTITEENA